MIIGKFFSRTVDTAYLPSGADVMHPPPGANDRPSFTAAVGSVDSHTAKYYASTPETSGWLYPVDIWFC